MRTDLLPRLCRINLYPVKSLSPVTTSSAQVLPSGALAGDRQFGFIDQNDRFMNAKRSARMHTVPIQLMDSPLRALCGPHLAGERTQVFALPSDSHEFSRWFSNWMEIDCQLVENRDVGFPDDTESPGPTIISRATLETVAGWFPGMTTDEARLRFRANLEIDGVPAFWEDCLFGEEGKTVELTIGACRFAGINPCQRCVVPSRNPTTGEVLPGFSKEFSRRREAMLLPETARSRFTHFYRLSVNTRLVGSPAMIHVGDPVTREKQPSL